MRKIPILISFYALLYVYGADYSLMAINNALNNPKQSSHIPQQSKKLLESTSGIKNYQANISPSLKAKLLAKENLLIRVLGDSHIAGDFFSHRLRTLFFKHYTFGLIYPLYPAYHQHIGLKFQSQNFEIFNSHVDDFNEYPLGGLIAKPVALPAYIRLIPKNDTSIALSKIIFKSPNKEGAIAIKDNTNQQFILHAKEPFVWQILTLKLQYPITLYALNEKVLFGGFFITNQEGGNNIIENLGINGARSDIWRKWDKNLIIREMHILPADLYVLCYGSNDAFYVDFDESLFLKNYAELIDTIQEANPNASILLLSPPPVVKRISHTSKSKKVIYKPTKHAKSVSKAVEKLAQQKHTLFFSIEDFIYQSGGKNKWEKANLSKPDVHLLPNGYKLVADKIYYELQRLE